MLPVSILLVRISWVLIDILINDSLFKMFHNSFKNTMSSLFDGCELFCLSALVSVSLHLYTHTRSRSVQVPLCPIVTTTRALKLISLPNTCPLYSTLLEQSFWKWLLWLLHSKPSTHSKFTVLNQSLKFLTPSGLWPLLITFLLLLTVPLRVASLPALPPIRNSLT